MSLGVVLRREPGEGITASDRVIYKAYIRSLDRPSRTTPERAVLRASRLCGVPRRRVVEVIRAINPDQEV